MRKLKNQLNSEEGSTTNTSAVSTREHSRCTQSNPIFCQRYQRAQRCDIAARHLMKIVNDRRANLIGGVMHTRVTPWIRST